MVFKSIRVGFPNAELVVCFNENGPLSCDPSICREVFAAKGNFVYGKTIHHDWITKLLASEPEPFFICDTDVAFFENFETFDFGDAPLAGRYVPQFFDRFTNCITRSRLHTSLLYINPERVLQEIEKWGVQFPSTPFNPKPDLISPFFHPFRTGSTVKNYFHDACSLLYHAVGGTSFSEKMMDTYGHLQFGTISDIVCPHYGNLDWRQHQFAAMDNPELLRGAWRHDDTFYSQNYAS
jgi:hypothetical protein